MTTATALFRRLVGWLADVRYRWESRCRHPGCWRQGEPCWYPSYTDEGNGEPDTYYCAEHCWRAGFCPECGQFWGGVESFEFSEEHLCDNCRSAKGYDEGEHDDLDEDIEEEYWP